MNGNTRKTRNLLLAHSGRVTREPKRDDGRVYAQAQTLWSAPGIREARRSRVSHAEAFAAISLKEFVEEKMDEFGR